MADQEMWGPAGHVLREVFRERLAQDVKWGEQHRPDGTSAAVFTALANEARVKCDASEQAGMASWTEILSEEVLEAFAEEDPARLRAELVQVAAVAAVWVQDIDHRMGRLTPKPPPVRLVPGPKQAGGGSGPDVPLGEFEEAVSGEPRWFLVHVGFETGRWAGQDREMLFLGRTAETVEAEAKKVFRHQNVLSVSVPTLAQEQTVQKWKRPSERRRRG